MDKSTSKADAAPQPHRNESQEAARATHGRGGAFAEWLVDASMKGNSGTNVERSVAREMAPPTLYQEGIKAQTPWLYAFLKNPDRLRYTTVLRMPQFNMSNDEAEKLANYFSAVDGAPYPYQEVPQREPEYLEAKEHDHPNYLHDGWQVVTMPPPTGFCAGCHSVGGREFAGGDPTKVTRGPNLDRVSSRSASRLAQALAVQSEIDHSLHENAAELHERQTGLSSTLRRQWPGAGGGRQRCADELSANARKRRQGDCRSACRAGRRRRRQIMNQVLQIENCKLKIANWRQRLAILSLGVLRALPLRGLPRTGDCHRDDQAGRRRCRRGGWRRVAGRNRRSRVRHAGRNDHVRGDAQGSASAGCRRATPRSSPKTGRCVPLTAVPNETLVVNPANSGLANAIIFLEKRPGNIKPELATPPTEKVLFDQKGCRFLPHVLVVQIGQPLLVVSDDPIPHNTHTRPKRNPEFNKLIAANERAGVPCVYKKPESGPISVVCDLHTWMKAYHFPIDHPYAAVTDKDGHFKIEGLPAGKHSFNVWHEAAPGGAQLLERKLQITIEVDKETTERFELRTDEIRRLRSPTASAVDSTSR